MSEQDNKPSVPDPAVGKTVAEIFGEIVWLASQDPDGRKLTVADLESLVMPAVILRQFHIHYARIPTTIESRGEAGATERLRPVSVELFAFCSQEVSEKLKIYPDAQLTLQQWRSGELKVQIRKFQANMASSDVKTH